ncbi:F-box/LRR-repeat protein At3g26922-like [Cornus florida]|uniref:F-box/LRR-repeat protein At3g26922-like n=1 Tax=Cornus florida TaxID=4283 RepID=UPI00289C0E7F|nr:F-box/LRR-repeat protein At3g26922-like [Cornus florida]
MNFQDSIMGRRQKAAKLMRGKDLLTELPDEILSTIISMLTLKEAVRTSVLSKKWKSIWTCHSDLCFDSITLLGDKVHFNNIANCKVESNRQPHRCKFVEQVDQIMHQRCKSRKIDSFTIQFHLGKESASHINQWIDCAIKEGVENMDVNLSECCSFKVDPDYSSTYEGYKFPFWLLAAPGKKSTIKHLRLVSCNLSAPPSSKCLSSLITLGLQNVTISDQQLENILSSCLFLEGLSLHQCRRLVNVGFVGPNHFLKFLSIKNCIRLKNIEIYAKNLVTFEYTGHLISFSFKNVPRLAEAFLSFTGESRQDGVSYSLTRFASDLPQLETLNLHSVLAMKTLPLPEDVPTTFTNIKQLVLSVYPFDDEDKLCWISYILKAFPLLQKLQLNLFCPNFIKQPKEIERVLPECKHKHVTEVEINGFYGNQHEAELLKYLVDNLVELKDLVVSLRQKVYNGFNNWVYEEASSWYKSRMESVGTWLDEVVPQSVHLIIG